MNTVPGIRYQSLCQKANVGASASTRLLQVKSIACDCSVAIVKVHASYLEAFDARAWT